MIELFANWLSTMGVTIGSALILARVITAGVTILLGFVAYFLAKRLLFPAVALSVSHTVTALDDVLASKRVSKHLAYLAPLLVFYFMIPIIFVGFDTVIEWLQKIDLLVMLLVSMLAVRALLQGLLERYNRLDVTREIPLTSFFQVISVLIYITAGLLALGIIMGRNPLYLLSGIGAFMAILTIVFRDPLLGLMAGIQLTSSKLIARGDLIALPAYDASGEVLNVALTTVTIRNADQSITTVPTYSLISESFKNWRGIEEYGARQIQRALLIDVRSVHLCSPEEQARLETLAKVDSPGDAQQLQLGLEDGSQQATNLELFRAYVLHYLRSLPHILQDWILLVRLLELGPRGWPLEIFAYSDLTDWVAFEAFQARIFEHLVVTAPEFGLDLYQDRFTLSEPGSATS